MTSPFPQLFKILVDTLELEDVERVLDLALGGERRDLADVHIIAPE